MDMRVHKTFTDSENALHVKRMEKAVVALESVEHSMTPVAALVCACDQDGETNELSTTNIWPRKIKDSLGEKARIGRSSGSVHAEMYSLFSLAMQQDLRLPSKTYLTYITDGSIYVTEATCTNCAEGIIASGIRNVFIDSKSFDTEFYHARQKDHFEGLTLAIYHLAGIGVYSVNRESGTIETLSEPDEDAHTRIIQEINKCVKIVDNEENLSLTDFVKKHREELSQEDGHNSIDYAVGRVLSRKDQREQFILTKAFSFANIGAKLPEDNKYSPLIDASDLLLMSVTRLGLSLVRSELFSSDIPTPRELVNLSGAAVQLLIIGDMARKRSEQSQDAMDLMQSHEIMNFSPL